MLELPANQQAKLAVEADFRAGLDANLTLGVIQEISLMDRLLAAIERLGGLVARGQVYQDYQVITVDAAAATRPLRIPAGSGRLRRLQAWTLTGFSGAGATLTIEGLTPWPVVVTLSIGVPQVLQLEWVLPPQPAVTITAANISSSTGRVIVTYEVEAL